MSGSSFPPIQRSEYSWKAPRVTSAKNVADSKLRMSSTMPAARSCCCSTAASSRVLSSVDVFMLRWKNAGRGVRKPVHQVLDKRLTIHRIGDRLAYSNVPEYGITQIERQISQ